MHGPKIGLEFASGHRDTQAFRNAARREVDREQKSIRSHSIVFKIINRVN